MTDDVLAMYSFAHRWPAPGYVTALALTRTRRER